jgi:hypothetical protein
VNANPDRTRLSAINGLALTIGHDLEGQVRKMVEEGWDPEDAFNSARSYWVSKVLHATDLARSARADIWDGSCSPMS